MGLPAHLVGLLQPAAYPHPAAAVQLLETPLSWVLIAGEFAYKVKRPVRLAFVDQSALDQRRRLCAEELRLNRRYAPELYVAVAPIVATAGAAAIASTAAIDGSGPPIEYAVVMRAFEPAAALDRLVAAEQASPAELAAFGSWLAEVQATLPVLAGAAAQEAVRRTAAAAARNAQECAAAGAAFGTAERIAVLAARLAGEWRQLESRLALRAADGRVRECHADLHLSNIVRLRGRLMPFDCLEFDPALRWIDVAEDIAFLYIDLVAYGAPALAAGFLNAWLQASGDYDACRLLRACGCDRALVRAKVMALRGDAPSLRGRHVHYLEVGADALRSPAPRCVMMCGPPGAGKSWLAAQLASALPALVVRSDLERRRHGARYDAAGKAAVYARMADCVAAALEGGFDVIADANHGQRAERAGIAALCLARNVPLTVVQCAAPLAVLRERIAARQAAARDPSAADGAVLQLQLASRVPIAPDEGLDVIDADTTRADVMDAVLVHLCDRK